MAPPMGPLLFANALSVTVRVPVELFKMAPPPRIKGTDPVPEALLPENMLLVTDSGSVELLRIAPPPKTPAVVVAKMKTAFPEKTLSVTLSMPVEPLKMAPPPPAPGDGAVVGM